MTGKQAIIGCGIGCAALVLIAVLVITGFSVWVTRPGELIVPERLFAEDSTGYVTWTLRLEDPGTAGFVTALIEHIEGVQQRQHEAVPQPLRGVLTTFNKGSGGDLRKLFPLALVWTSSPGGSDQDDLRLLSISLASLGNRIVFIDLMLGIMLGHATHQYGGEQIYSLKAEDDRTEALTFFIRGNDLFFVSDLSTAQRAVDRLGGVPPAERPATELDRLYALTPPSAALRGAISNARGEFARLWNEFAQDEGEEPAWDELSGVVISGGLGPDGAFDGVIELIGRDESWAAERSAPQVAAIRTWLDRAPFEVESSSAAVDGRVRINLRIPDLAHSLEHASREPR